MTIIFTLSALSVNFNLMHIGGRIANFVCTLRMISGFLISPHLLVTLHLLQVAYFVQCIVDIVDIVQNK